MDKKIIVSFFILLSFGLIFYYTYDFLQSVDSDSTIYMAEIKNGSWVRGYPLLLWIGILLPESFFWIVPAFCFFFSLFILLFFVLKENLQVLLLPFLLLAEPTWMSFIFVFHRDTVLLLLSTVSLFLFYLHFKSNKDSYFVGSLFFCFLSSLTKTAGFYLFFFIIGLKILLEMKKRVNLNSRFFSFMPLYPNIAPFVFIFISPVAYLLGFFALLRKSFFSSAIFLFFFSASVYISISYDVFHFFRYSFFLSFFAIFVILKEFSFLARWQKIVFVVVIGLLMVFNSFPYLLFLANNVG